MVPIVCRDCVPDDLIHRVEHERVPPHDDSDGVVAHDQTVCGDEQALRLRNYPNAQDGEDIDKVTQISQEVVVALFMVRIVTDRHKPQELRSVPVREVVRVQADQVPRDEDIHDSGNEGSLLSCSDGERLVEAHVETIHGLAHTFLIQLKLFALSGHPAPPFIDILVFCDAPVLCLVLQPLRLR